MKKKEVGLSRDEKFIIKVLALAWDAYFKLPELHIHAIEMRCVAQFMRRNTL